MAYGAYLVRQGPEISGVQAMLYTDSNDYSFHTRIAGLQREGWRVVEKDVYEVACLIEAYGLGRVRNIIGDLLSEGIY